MPTRTIKQMIIRVSTNLPVPEDSGEMENEQILSADINFTHAEDAINDQLPIGYYCKVESP